MASLLLKFFFVPFQPLKENKIKTLKLFYEFVKDIGFISKE